MALVFDRFELDLGEGELRTDGEPVALRAKPLALLLYLDAHRDHGVAKHELFEHVWPGTAICDVTLASALHDLRKALGDNGHSQHVVRTLRGRGYRFVASPNRVASERAAR